MLESAQIKKILDELTAYSRNQNYRGYNKHDGLNSPILKLILGWSKWARIVAVQAVMRFPLNMRPLIFTRKTYNPKGLALFSMGCMQRYSVEKRPQHLDEAEKLLRLLQDIHSPGEWSGIAWGYHYPWQDPGFYATTNTPNAVVTCFVCESFLEAYRITQKETYLEIVKGAIDFFLNDLTVLKDEGDEMCLGYMPIPMTMRVMDVSILIGTVIAQYVALSNSEQNKQALGQTAERLVRYVINQQTDAGAWFYTDPPGDSYIRHDNYHTGFILDAIWRYMQATRNFEWQACYDIGLAFYAENHFMADGAPRWMSDTDYPFDIHGAAQGTITFARHQEEYPGLALKIATWAVDNMYRGGGRFAYQKHRYYTKSFTLLRWCNGWMFRALSCLQYHQAPTDPPKPL